MFNVWFKFEFLRNLYSKIPTSSYWSPQWFNLKLVVTVHVGARLHVCCVQMLESQKHKLTNPNKSKLESNKEMSKED